VTDVRHKAREGQPSRSEAKDDHVSCRIDDPTRDRIDALIPAFSTRWRQAKLGEVVRALLLEGLDAVEKRVASGGAA
jgi:hypothetical protein